jgi:hypothetical protein
MTCLVHDCGNDTGSSLQLIIHVVSEQTLCKAGIQFSTPAFTDIFSHHFNTFRPHQSTQLVDQSTRLVAACSSTQNPKWGETFFIDVADGANLSHPQFRFVLHCPTLHMAPAASSLSVFCADLLLPFFCSAKLTARSHAVVFLLQKSASVPIQRKPNVRHTHIHALHRTTQTHTTHKLYKPAVWLPCYWAGIGRHMCPATFWVRFF